MHRMPATLALLALALPATLQAAAPASLPPLVVTASPVDTTLAESMRSVRIISREEILDAPADNLADLLAMLGGVDLRRRGAPGAQADLGIRGSNFEQTLVLLDGVPLGNPQTGHHNLDLPLPLAQIERIEIVTGPGALQYGASATGGVVNIVARRPVSRERHAHAALGSQRARRAGLALGDGDSDGARSQFLSIEAGRIASEHPAQPTDLGSRALAWTGTRAAGNAALRWGLAASHKAFGAWGFYSAAYPDAREHTDATLAWLGLQLPLGAWELDARLSWNGHGDWFDTRIGGRDYTNEHRSGSLDLAGDLRRRDAGGATLIGFEIAHQRLRSNALANHRRQRGALWLLRRQQLGERLAAEFGLNHAAYSEAGSYWLPSLAFSWRLDAGWLLHAATARSARAPSWTELWLDTGANRGNPMLRPERSRLEELGLRGEFAGHAFATALFHRRSADLIDWVLPQGTDTWRAVNLAGYRARGLDLDWRWQPREGRLREFGLGYELLDARVDPSAGPVKYALAIPRQAWRAHARLGLGGPLELAIDLRRPDYRGQPSATLVAARIAWRHEGWRAHVGIDNALDERVVETGFAPIPGRRFQAGLEVNF